MLGDKDAIATVAVKDLDKARKFYEGVLGLRVADSPGKGASSSSITTCPAVLNRGTCTPSVSSRLHGSRTQTATSWR